MTPVNKQAAIVTAPDYHLDREFWCGDKVSSMVPLPIKMWHGPAEHDLTGVKFGRFVVVGVLDTNKRYSNGVRWVVRCSCGRYEVRRTRTIKEAHPKNMCSECGRTNKDISII